MTYSDKFQDLVNLYKRLTITYPNLKPITLAQWILESGRGSSPLAEDHNNFAGMKWRSAMKPYAKRVLYNAHDGRGYYCEFRDLENFVKGYWAFLERPPYEGWEAHAGEGETFIEFIGPIWAEDTSYVEKVLNLVDEANELLGVTPTEPIDEKVEEDEDDEMSRGSLVSGGSQIALDATGDIAIGRNGLETDYRGDPNCPYGRSATANKREFVAVVLHHTAPDQDTNWYVQYQIDGDSARRGHFGYHFYISPDGRILQGAPLGKRTNQVKSPSDSVRYSFGSKASNRNSIGISCVGAALVSGSRTIGSRPTPQQTDAVYNLAFALCDLYSISFLDVYGHGEIQSNRHEEEGRDLAQVIRSWTHSDG